MQLTKNLLQQATEISKHLKEPEWLLEYRLKNLEMLNVLQPEKSIYTDMKKLDELMQNAAGKNGKAKIEIKGNTSFSKISDAAVQEKVKSCLDREIPRSRAEVFTNAFFTEGFFAEVEGSTGVKIEGFGNAIIKGIFSAIGEKAEISETILGSPESIFYNNNVVVGENSTATFNSMQNIDENSLFMQSRNNYLSRYSKIHSGFAWLGGGQTKSYINNFLQGSGAELYEKHVLFATEKQQFDIKQLVFHQCPSTNGRTAYKAALDGASSAVFDGMIKIAKDAENTDSFLEAHSMILKKGCKSNNIPGLEIENNNVKATHSATVTQIDDEHLFYITSRGISKENAKKMIVLGFLECIANEMKGNASKEFIAEIEKKYKT